MYCVGQRTLPVNATSKLQSEIPVQPTLENFSRDWRPPYWRSGRASFGQHPIILQNVGELPLMQTEVPIQLKDSGYVQQHINGHYKSWTVDWTGPWPGLPPVLVIRQRNGTGYVATPVYLNHVTNQFNLAKMRSLPAISMTFFVSDCRLSTKRHLWLFCAWNEARH